jgi:hypothetical protein
VPTPKEVMAFTTVNWASKYTGKGFSMVNHYMSEPGTFVFAHLFISQQHPLHCGVGFICFGNRMEPVLSFGEATSLEY